MASICAAVMRASGLRKLGWRDLCLRAAPRRIDAVLLVGRAAIARTKAIGVAANRSGRNGEAGRAGAGHGRSLAFAGAICNHAGAIGTPPRLSSLSLRPRTILARTSAASRRLPMPALAPS